jgi:predicted nucleic acid-binding protein
VPDFLDSNILVYAYDERYREKRGLAAGLVRRAVAGEFVVSTQVLAEFASTLLQKFDPRVSPADLVLILDTISPIGLIAPDAKIVRRAVEARAEYGVHFYDGMIIAAAERAGAKKIYSEDLSAGQKYFGMEIVDPFR